jgi:hypothetical protein
MVAVKWWILLGVCFLRNLRITALCVAAGVSKYIGIFTKVAPFDQAKAVPGGMGARYGRAPPVSVLVNASGWISSTLVDL